MKTSNYKPATPAKRVLAFVIEVLILIAYMVSVNGIFDDSYGQDGSVLIAILSYMMIHLALMTRSTTIGKMVLNMKVVNRRSRKDLSFFDMLFRETLGKFLSVIFFAIGFIWIIIDNENRGWHDMIFGSMVIEMIPETTRELDEHDDDFYVQG